MAVEPGREVNVEVAFALPGRQRIIPLTLPTGTCAREAVREADLARYFPEVPPETFEDAALGIFGKALRDPDRYIVQEGDRVEVYRPLRIDPKAARAARAADKRD
ncbi:RnfH family protein [Halomonas sp. I1]|uniref:RnfH family protein n=1 Tax=Halomonas sp. I1 TaxID=393536 RepID=UPI0028DDF649|nr:RnfH family protein [Halomonas sp. I1]MDT8893557.1 RnfH family protein [Halomonas sp. I1]